MADSTVTALTAATTLDGTELYYGVQAAADAKVTGNQIRTLAQKVVGSGSGIISILPQAAAGTYNFNLPITAGNAGDLLTSGAGGSAPMTWTTPVPVNNLTDTWNNVSTTFTAIKMNVTDTTSAAGSLLMDLQDSSVSKFNVSKIGAVTQTGVHTITQGTANTPALVVTGYSVTGSGTTALLDLAGTFNTSGAATGIKLNITNTSGNSAHLIDLQAGGVTKFNVDPSGNVNIATNAAMVMPANFSLGFGSAAGQNKTVAAGQWGWVPSTNVAVSIDTSVARNAAGVVEVNNGTNGTFADIIVRNARTNPTIVASLTAAATAGAGARSFVTDATATTFLSIVAGTGSNKVPVVSDGTNWLIA